LQVRALAPGFETWAELTIFHNDTENPDASSRLRNLRILVNGLPEVNKSTVFYILRFLSKVVASEQVNRFTTPNRRAATLWQLIIGP